MSKQAYAGVEFTILASPFDRPAVVQQEAEQAEQDEANSSQDRQQKHSVVHVEVLGEDRTCPKKAHRTQWSLLSV